MWTSLVLCHRHVSALPALLTGPLMLFVYWMPLTKVHAKNLRAGKAVLGLILFLSISPFQWEAGQETFPGYKKKGDGHLSHMEYAAAYSGGRFLNNFLSKLIESIHRTPLSSVRRR